MCTRLPRVLAFSIMARLQRRTARTLARKEILLEASVFTTLALANWPQQKVAYLPAQHTTSSV